jgi:hypothetical protein
VTGPEAITVTITALITPHTMASITPLPTPPITPLPVLLRPLILAPDLPREHPSMSDLSLMLSGLSFPVDLSGL